MRISDPILVPDVSIWCDHINPKEFEDAGCASVVVGLYPSLDNLGGKVLSSVSRQQCIDVATKSSMLLQVYFWDDIVLDPIRQADWLAQTIKMEGLPIKWTWIDQEQWWTNWTAWQQARGGRIPMSEVPAGTPDNISSHFENFMRQFHNQVAQSGVYTNKGFVTSWAPGMDRWLSLYRAWVPNYGRQPKQATQMTWDHFKANWLPDYDIVLSRGQTPELVVGHQFTGDCCILPGAYDRNNGRLPLDVSMFSKAFLDELKGTIPSPAPPTPPAPTTPPAPSPTTDYVVLYARINVRARPDSNATWVRYAVKDEVLHVLKVENGWAQIADGTYVFAGYLSAATANIPAPVPTPVPAPVPQPASVDYVVLYARINVRAKPDSNSTWIRFAVKDEVLHVVKIEKMWAQLTDGTYVVADYIKKV